MEQKINLCRWLWRISNRLSGRAQRSKKRNILEDRSNNEFVTQSESIYQTSTEQISTEQVDCISGPRHTDKIVPVSEHIMNESKNVENRINPEFVIGQSLEIEILEEIISEEQSKQSQTHIEIQISRLEAAIEHCYQNQYDLLVLNFVFPNGTTLPSGQIKQAQQILLHAQAKVQDLPVKIMISVRKIGIHWEDRESIAQMVDLHKKLLEVAQAESIDAWVTLLDPWKNSQGILNQKYESVRETKNKQSDSVLAEEKNKQLCLDKALMNSRISDSAYPVLEDGLVVKRLHHQCVLHGTITNLIKDRDLLSAVVIDIPVVARGDDNSESILEACDQIGLLAGYSILGPLLEGAYPIEIIRLIPELPDMVQPGDINTSRAGVDLVILAPTGAVRLEERTEDTTQNIPLENAILGNASSVPNAEDRNSLIGGDFSFTNQDFVEKWVSAHTMLCHQKISAEESIWQIAADIDATFSVPIALLVPKMGLSKIINVANTCSQQGMDMRGVISNA